MVATNDSNVDLAAKWTRQRSDYKTSLYESDMCCVPRCSPSYYTRWVADSSAVCLSVCLSVCLVCLAVAVCVVISGQWPWLTSDWSVKPSRKSRERRPVRCSRCRRTRRRSPSLSVGRRSDGNVDKVCFIGKLDRMAGSLAQLAGSVRDD